MSGHHGGGSGVEWGGGEGLLKKITSYLFFFLFWLLVQKLLMLLFRIRKNKKPNLEFQYIIGSIVDLWGDLPGSATNVCITWCVMRRRGGEIKFKGGNNVGSKNCSLCTRPVTGYLPILGTRYEKWFREMVLGINTKFYHTNFSFFFFFVRIRR